MKALAINKLAKRSYQILETFEAGLKLSGMEVKSAKAGNVSLKGSYVSLRPVKGGTNYEAWLINMHISLYEKAGSRPHYNPTRERKLLLNKKEIQGLIGKLQQKGLTLVPLKLYTKRRFVKMEIALARGRSKQDKREDIKKREADRNIERALKQRS